MVLCRVYGLITMTERKVMRCRMKKMMLVMKTVLNNRDETRDGDHDGFSQ